MGTFSFMITIPKPIVDVVNLLVLLKFIVMEALFYLGISNRRYRLRFLEHSGDYVHAEDRRQPPSPDPTEVISRSILESIKDELRVVGFDSFVDGMRKRRDGEDWSCAICLNCLRGRDQIRELQNCSHVFHRECLDRWVDEGLVTCPLCRSKLVFEQSFVD